MRKVNIYRCPKCNKPFKTIGGWGRHMDLDHPDARPKGYTDARFFYMSLTGKTHGNCIVCRTETGWNETTQKYNRFCDNPKCKEIYRDKFKARMIGKYGKVHLLNDPDQQRKMLKGRSISGSYKFRDGGKIDYVGSYEKDFLTMMDTFLHFKSTDIMAPSPHTYQYRYENEDHFYIPDFFIPNLNLEIEIKDAQTTHPKFIAVDKVKEKLKDEVMASIKEINYIKLVDKQYANFFEYLLSLKDSVDESEINHNPSMVTESTAPDKSDESISMDTDDIEKIYESVFCAPGISDSKSDLSIAQEANALLPSILVPITVEPGENAMPMDVESSLSLATPDPTAPEKPSYQATKTTECFRMINRFSAIAPTKRQEKAIEIKEFILNNNLSINIMEYPLVAKCLPKK